MHMEISYYSIQGPANTRIALVSDLHERKPDEVIQKLKEIQPDLICVVGDMLERTDKGVDPRNKKDNPRFFHLLHALAHIVNDLLFLLFKNEGNPCSENTYAFFFLCQEIAPVYYSLGNHEYYLNDRDKDVLKKCQVTLLDNDWIQKGDLVIGGVSPNIDEKMLNGFEKQKGFKLLLCHHPEFYEKYIQDRKIDCVLSGHAHGGQIRLFHRGLFSPNQGFFPKYTKGKYGKLIVSAGCSNTAAIPRINNPEEIVCIDIKRK